MRILSSQRGVTLNELLVSSIMIGLVMLGVASFTVSIKRLYGSSSKSNILALQLKSAVASIAQDASLATGTGSNQGVYTWSNGLDTNSACFRFDENDTPDNLNDDAWACYLNNKSNKIYRGVNADFDIASGCIDEKTCFGNSPKIFMTEIADKSMPFSEIIYDTEGRLAGVNITLTARHFNNKPEHPVSNPSLTVSTLVSPAGHSR